MLPEYVCDMRCPVSRIAEYLWQLTCWEYWPSCQWIVPIQCANPTLCLTLFYFLIFLFVFFVSLFLSLSHFPYFSMYILVSRSFVFHFLPLSFWFGFSTSLICFSTSPFVLFSSFIPLSYRHLHFGIWFVPLSCPFSIYCFVFFSLFFRLSLFHSTCFSPFLCWSSLSYISPFVSLSNFVQCLIFGLCHTFLCFSIFISLSHCSSFLNFLLLPPKKERELGEFL